MSKNQRRSISQLPNNQNTIDYSNNSNKSIQSTRKNHHQNPQHIIDKLSHVNMELMFETNKQYLMDKIAISEIPKPSKYYHKIPSKTPNTTYNNQFHKINPNFMNQLKLQRKDNLYNSKNNVTNYQSLYCENFNHLAQRSKSLASTMKNTPSKPSEKIPYQPNDAPTFLETSYSLNFVGNYNPVPAQSTKMKEVKLMGGGAFKGQTTYHGVFKSHDQKRQRPIHQINNKIFMTIDTPKQTTYQKEFNSAKKSQTIKTKSSTVKVEEPKSARKRVNSQMLETNKQMQKKKFKSEYERSFQTLQPNNNVKSKKVALMSLQQMKNLILNVL